MSKFLCINANEMRYLKRRAVPDMVFGSPNDVLRSILGLEPKKKPKQQSTGAEGVTKIRIDDEVLEQLKARAKQLNMNNIKHLDKLLEKIWRLELGGEEENEDLPRRRPPIGSRPAARRG